MTAAQLLSRLRGLLFSNQYIASETVCQDKLQNTVSDMQPQIVKPTLPMQAVTTAVALEFGLGSSLFAVALCFTVITMYDATGVRRHAGKQLIMIF